MREKRKDDFSGKHSWKTKSDSCTSFATERSSRQSRLRRERWSPEPPRPARREPRRCSSARQSPPGCWGQRNRSLPSRGHGRTKPLRHGQAWALRPQARPGALRPLTALEAAAGSAQRRLRCPAPIRRRRGGAGRLRGEEPGQGWASLGFTAMKWPPQPRGGPLNSRPAPSGASSWVPGASSPRRSGWTRGRRRWVLGVGGAVGGPGGPGGPPGPLCLGRCDCGGGGFVPGRGAAELGPASRPPLRARPGAGLPAAPQRPAARAAPRLACAA